MLNVQYLKFVDRLVSSLNVMMVYDIAKKIPKFQKLALVKLKT